MIVTELYDLAKTLSPQERQELAMLLMDSLNIDQPTSNKKRDHKRLVRLIREFGPVDMKYPEIEDPVEWVQQIRRDERRERLGDWGDDND